MPTRQELARRHKMAEEARAKLKSGGGGQQPKQGYQTRQQLADAYRAAHPAPPEPTPVGSSFSGDPRTMDLNVPNGIKQFQQAHTPSPRSVVELPSTANIPDSKQSLRSTFNNKPVDSRLLPGNANARSASVPSKSFPLKAGYDQLVHGMQTAVNFQQQPTDEVPSTGSKGLDSFLRVTGGFLPGLASGAPLAGNLASDTGSAVQRAGDTLAPKLVSKVFQASPQSAYAIQKAAPVVSKVAGHAVGAGVENAAVGAAAGQTDAKQVGENFGMGAAFGGGGSALASGGKSLVRAAAVKVSQTADDLFHNSPIYKAMVADIGEAGTRAEIGKKQLADIDEQIQSVSKGTAPDKSTQYKNLFAERNATIDYIKQHEPEFEAPKPRVAVNSNSDDLAPIAELPKKAPRVKKTSGVAPLPNPQAVPGEAPLPKKQAAPKKPSEPVRSNYATMQEAEGLSPELKKEIAKNDPRYEPITNEETVAAADKDISKHGVDKSVNNFLASKETGAQNIAKGYRLMQILDARGEHEVAAEVAAKVAANLTKAGQEAQAGRIIKKLSPEGQSLALARVAEENGKTVTAVDQKNFSANAKVRAETMGAELRTNAVHDTVDNAKAGQAPTAEDIATVKNTIERAKKQLPTSKPKAAKPKPAASKRDKVLEKLQAAEDEAWKRIKARRNIGFTPGKGNEFVDYAIIAANRVARGTVKASNHVEQIVKMFGEEMRPHATKIYNMGLKHLARHPELKTIRQNIKTAEQVVEQWAKKTSTTGEDLKTVRKLAAKVDKGRAADALEKVRELAEAVGKLEGKQGKKADIAMQQIMNKYEKSSITDKVQALRYMDMLGNTHTQELNLSSNVATAAFYNTMDIFGAMVDVAVSKALKRERSTAAFGMNPIRWSWRVLKYMKEGAHANWKGVNPGGLHSVDEVRGLAFQSKWWNLAGLNWGERGLKAVAGGSDYAVYRTQFENELVKQAKLAAGKAKIKGKAETAKFYRDFLANPPSEALEMADYAGKESTYQQKNSLGNVISENISSLGHLKGGKKWPGKIAEQGVRTIVPFIRTPFNILEIGVSLTPGGVIRGIAQLIAAKTPVAQRAAIRHLGLGLIGSGMSAAGYYLHKIGVITDANDSGNKNLDSVREQSGKGAYRFNQSGMWRYLKTVMGGGNIQEAEKVAGYQEGDRTFNYNKLQPFAFPVALGAGLHAGGVEGGLTQAAGSLLSMSMVKSIQDVISTGYSGSEGEKQLGAVNRWVESYLKSFSPSLLAQEARREDTTQRQTAFNQGYKQDLGDYYKSRIPSLGGIVPEKYTSKSLPAKVTPLGQTKQGTHNNVAGNFINPIQSDIQQYSKAAAIIGVLIDKTGDDSIAPSAPPKAINGVKIPPKRYEQYQRDIGNEITEKVLRVWERDISDDRKVKQIAQIILDTKSKYRVKLKHELGIRDNLK